MPKDTYDDVILTDAERAALDDFDNPDEQETDETDEAADEVQAADEKEAAPEKDREAKAAPTDETDVLKAADEKDPEPANFAYTPPALDAEQQAKAEQEIISRLESIDTELDALSEQFDDGELGAKEYRAAAKKLQTEARELTAKRAANEAEARTLKAQEKYRAEQAAQYAQAKWEASVEHWASQGDNVKYNTNRVLSQYMIDAVKQIRATQEGAQLPNLAVLKKARENVDTMLREAGFLPASETGKPKPKPKAKQPDIPPNLGDVPAAARNDSGDEFSHLDNLTGMALEKAIARMSDAQRDRWLRH